MLPAEKGSAATLLAGLVACCPAMAAAQIATFSDFGAGSGPGYGIYGPEAVTNASQAVAMQFTAQVTGELTSVDLGI
ncbi:MAG: hypothetical protein ACYC96_08635 [Fimbriimonadaceae bacterium]